jgi:aspartate kinase
VSLGRGGSDFTAVALAVALGAESCELIKDAGGYFSADPRLHASAAPVHALSYGRALALADQGCPVVQRGALQLAKQAELVIHVRSLAGNTGTTIGPGAAHALENLELCGSAA